MQRALPEVLYTCPMHPDVLHEKPGSCPICKMQLDPVRIEEEIWYACPIHAATLGPSPGVCPLDNRTKMPVVVTVHWACPQSPDEKLMEPGTCADGGTRREIHQIRAHGDHNPRHGGQFFMAVDNWHHIEGTYPSRGLFRVYFYDNFTQPIDVKRFAARIVADGRPDVLLKPGRGNTMEASLSDRSTPIKLTLKVRFSEDTPESQFDFAFNELTKEPPSSPFSPAAGPAAKAAPRSAAAENVPEGAAAVAPPVVAAVPPPVVPALPALTGCEPNLTRTDVLLLSDALPKNAPALLDLLATCRTEIQKLIDGYQFGFVYQPTMLAKDIALALEAHLNPLPEQRRSQAADGIRLAVLSAWQLDAYGDLGNQGKLTDAFKRFAAAVDDIISAYDARP
jgi:hypothetical protein